MMQEHRDFNKFFIKSKSGKVAFNILLEKLNLDENELIEYLNSKNLEIIELRGRKYLNGWKYRDEARTPLSVFPDANTEMKQEHSLEMNSIIPQSISQEDIERLRLYNELEEHKKALKLKNKEIDRYKNTIKNHAREKLELEEAHRAKMDELAEKVSLGHSLNDKIQNIINTTKRDLETLSGKDVKILLLVDFYDNLKRHNRSVFIPRDQNYTFEVGHEFKHHNPDLRTHFL